MPTYQEVVHIARSFPTTQESALFAITYLTGGRISEIMPKKALYKRVYKKHPETGKILKNKQGSPIIASTDQVEHGYSGIKKRDLYEDTIGGRDGREVHVLVISIENRKNKEDKRKTCPCPIEKESELMNIVREYLSMVAFEDVLFPFSEGKARRIINKVGFNPHYLRDIRATHLVWNYQFTEYALIQFMGWTDGRPAKRYVRKDWRKIGMHY